MRCSLLSLTAVVILVCVSLGAGQEKRVNLFSKLRKGHTDKNTRISLRASRQTLVIPMTWKEVFFRYDRLPSAGPYAASVIFDFARLYDLDTLRLLNDSTVFQFAQPELAEFFRAYKPLSLERGFNSFPFDTIRVNSKGQTQHRHDMSVSYRIHFADTSHQGAADMLSRISGIRVPPLVTQMPLSRPPDMRNKVTITQGIWGQVWFWEGDFMPTIGDTIVRGTVLPVARQVLVYELTNFKTVESVPYSMFVKRIPTRKVATSTSDSTGFFQIPLPCGEYSILIKEDSLYYFCSLGGNGNIAPVTVLTDSVARVQIDIRYKASE